MDPRVATLNGLFDRMEVPLKVLETPAKGKHVIATKNLAAGTALFEEAPIVSWPFPDAGHASCDRCLAVVGSSNDVVCPECSVPYCSEGCREAAVASHRFLCGVTPQLRATTAEDPSLPITAESVGRCVAFVAKRLVAVLAQNPGVPGPQLFDAAAEPINRLVEPPKSAKFDEVNEEKWWAVINTAMRPALAAALPEAFVGALLSSETLHTMLGQLCLNSQALSVKVPQAKEGDTVISEAAGVFTLQSCFNHSCAPTAEVTFTDTHEICVRMKADVAEGQEVCITYISPLYLEFENVHQRRQRLKPYLFVCACERCKADEKSP